MPIDYDHLAERLANLKTNRRRFGVGAAGAVASLSGAAVLATRALGNESSPPDPTQPALAVENQPADRGRRRLERAERGSDRHPIRSASRRSERDGARLLAASAALRPRLAGCRRAGRRPVPSWIEVGSALDLAVAPVAINGVTMDGLAAGQTFADYEELAGFLNSADGYGGVALVPADQVDARVNVLAVDGFDPVRNGQFDEPTMRIGFVGDIVPGRNVGIKMREYNDYTHPFHRVAAILSSYDLTIANLEGDLSDDLPVPTEGATFDFVASTQMIDGLAMAGIDAVSQANNHSTWNSAGWGTQGLTDTIDALDARSFGHFGGGRTLDEARAALHHDHRRQVGRDHRHRRRDRQCRGARTGRDRQRVVARRREVRRRHQRHARHLSLRPRHLPARHRGAGWPVRHRHPVLPLRPRVR